MSWVWVAEAVVFAIHDRQIAEHGGSSGLRDKALVLSALARPMNVAAYGNPDVADLAAAYGFGLCKNHGFVDGNKRTAWVVARLFLRLNDAVLRRDPADSVALMQAVAGGQMDEAALAGWFRQHLWPPAARDAVPGPC